MKKGLIVAGVIVVIAVLVVLNLRREGSKVEVDVTGVKRRAINKLVTASGWIQAKRQVDVSASAIGKVTRVAVREGDRVKRGDFLLQIDPTDYQVAVDQLNASIRSARAEVEMQQANVRKAEYDYDRAKALHDRKVVSDEELRNAELALQAAQARGKSAQEILVQHRATLNKAAHDLAEVRITAGISGVITSLNVEEGENAIMGTLNNPGTVLLTIADLSEIETEVEVDETEVVFVRVGQQAAVMLDAYPNRTFAGVVTEVGNSAIRSQIGLGQSSVDFKVVISVQDSIPNVRPGLSASADIGVAEEKDALSIPIQCLTVRQRSELEGIDVGGQEDNADTLSQAGPADEKKDVEGVFVVENGVVSYRPIVVGIAGSDYFHVTHGLSEGEMVVSGPFKAINELKHGDPVKVSQQPTS
ncbi:MAG: efflux RND transporter periplasmic adaptor subunit [Candidatus Krumholzibacteria bacterium]|nr:efflux RND transporter periplasmic adaptor subunit [Candidatus Krumholzibacteria bacterium]